MQKKKNVLLLLTFLVLTFLLQTGLSFQTAFASSSATLKIGMKNDAVNRLQSDLKTLGFMNIKPTGYFGTITKSAVIRFQKKYGLTPDGLAGTITLGKIDKLLGRSKTTSRGDLDRESPVMVTNVIKQWIPGLPQVSYNKGMGMYEGVALHYTANPNDTAQTEANYIRNNSGVAFAHEYVDAKQIIQVANPNYDSWGAGPNANHRFVQIELCNSNTQADFDKSYAMYCERAAEYLFARKLGVTPAQPNGTGTLWSHYDVTRYLGGTDHSDPIAYLAKWGKTWQDVIDTVAKDYNKLVADNASAN